MTPMSLLYIIPKLSMVDKIHRNEKVDEYVAQCCEVLLNGLVGLVPDLVQEVSFSDFSCAIDYLI